MSELSNPQSGPEKGPIKASPFDSGGYLFFAVRPLMPIGVLPTRLTHHA